MPYPVIGVLLGFFLTVVWFAVLVLVEVYREVRNPTVVTCPALGAETAVRLHPLEDRLPLVTGCSRWPAHSGCNQACVEQIAPVGSQARYQSNA